MPNNAVVHVGRGPFAARFGAELPLALIAGPCQLESRAHALEMAAALKEIAARREIGLVFKTSFDKANRTSGAGARGVGLEAALPIFAEIRETLGLPVLTDVHEAHAMRDRGAGGRRAANSRLPLPPDRSFDRGGAHGPGGQRQEGPVPGALGHEACRGENRQRRRRRTCW